MTKKAKVTPEDYALLYAEIRKLVTERVRHSRSFHDLWLLWRDTFMAAHGLTNDDDDHRFILEILQQAFYAGAATSWELVTRVIPDAITEDEGAKMLTRFNDELDAWTKGFGIS